MAAAVPELHAVTPEAFARDVAPLYRPVVVRGLAAHWLAVAAGREGPEAVADYLKRHAGARPLKAMVGKPAIKGRFFYDAQMRGFNFERVEAPLPVLVDELLRMRGHAGAPAVYAGSAPAEEAAPGFARANVLPLPAPGAVPRLWIGNASRVAAHYDGAANIAVVAAGRRRFRLFPPEAGANLYVGPLDLTPAGQPISLVDLEDVDRVRFPRFAEAEAAMQVADLEPGDAIYIPPLWWHAVAAEGPLNLLVNYWFGEEPALSPFTALVHALSAVRDLPDGERAAVKAWFDHYVFGEDARSAADHIPPAARGVLDASGPGQRERTRAFLLKDLAR